MFRFSMSIQIVSLAILCAFGSAASVPGIAPAADRLTKDYGQLPLYFLGNQGQTSPEVQYYTRANGFSLGFTPQGPVFLLHPGENQPQAARAGFRAAGVKPAAQAPAARQPASLRLTLMGLNPEARIVPAEPQAGKVNYFLGRDPKKWVTDIPTYGAVVYQEAYPGIDLKFYGNGRELEYDIIARPGADYRRVKFRYTGVKNLRLTPAGDLALTLPDGGVLLQKRPVVYQEIAGQRVAREGKFKLCGKAAQAVFGFEVAAYDRKHPLVIDPVLVYSSYLGGSGFDGGYGVAVDAAGNIYVAGQTNSTDFPLQNPYQDHRASIYNQVFVTKFNPQGSALIYSTYLGGSDGVQGEGKGEQYCNALAVDQNGCAYVTGYTYSTNFPTQHPYQADHLGNQCIFVTKFNAQGNGLAYSTYLGQGGNNFASGIAVDQDGNAYLAGQSTGDFPTTPGAFQPDFAGGSDAVVAKFNAAGSSLLYATFLGGAENDGGRGIAVDNSGHAYVTGYTTVNDSGNFPTTAGVTQPSPIGSIYSRDVFVTKLNTDGSGLVYSTYLGGTNIYGSGSTYGMGIAVDAAGNAYVTGDTDATSNFPLKKAAQPTPGGGHWQYTDAFVTAYNPTATDYLFSTYLGGSSYDSAIGIAVCSAAGGHCYVHVTGSTRSANFPTKYPFQASLYPGGQSDAFVSKFDAASGALVFSTYLGGTGLEQGYGIATDRHGNAYMVGYTQSTNFPTTPNAYQATSPGGGQNAFVVKFANPMTGSDQMLLLLDD